MTSSTMPLATTIHMNQAVPSRRIAVSALVLGAAADLLMRERWGVNSTLWFAALTIVTLWVRRSGRDGHWTSETYWFAPALTGALLLAFHDNPTLRFLNLVALMLALTLPMLNHQRVNLGSALPGDLTMAAARMALTTAAAPFQLAGELATHDAVEAPSIRRVRAIAGGVLVGLPVALIFTSLFAQADPMLRSALESLVDWRAGKLIEHAAAFAVGAWFAAGAARSLALHADRNARPLNFAAPFTPPSTSVVSALATTTGAFLLFVASQARQLFAGHDLIAGTPGLSYAQHAKDGFFELLAVSVLVLPLLYASEWLTEKRPAEGRTSLRAMQSVLLLLVFLVMLSAAYRMQLYVGAYGLTEDRLYGSALMLWLAIVAVGFGVTVLRGHRRSFAQVLVAASFAAVGALNIVNPDALIARVNLSRFESGRQFDARHAASLGPDAIPVLARALETLPPADQCTIVSSWRSRGLPDGWRSANLGLVRAVRVLERMGHAGACEAATSRPAGRSGA